MDKLEVTSVGSSETHEAELLALESAWDPDEHRAARGWSFAGAVLTKAIEPFATGSISERSLILPRFASKKMTQGHDIPRPVLWPT
jgi:hypothetical protein